jgi:hypothetical protein
LAAGAEGDATSLLRNHKRLINFSKGKQSENESESGQMHIIFKSSITVSHHFIWPIPVAEALEAHGSKCLLVAIEISQSDFIFSIHILIVRSVD